MRAVERPLILKRASVASSDGAAFDGTGPNRRASCSCGFASSSSWRVIIISNSSSESSLVAGPIVSSLASCWRQS
jgi:hypothetical protein